MIVLFAQYYKPKSRNRRDEINECFRKNIENQLIDRVVILFEDDADMSLFPDKPNIEKKLFKKRVTYGDWLEMTNDLEPGTISIIVNSDIYLDETVSYLKENAAYIDQNKIFIALSRYNITESEHKLNQNPHWTQDTWAIYRGDTPIHRGLLQEARFELGHPGCDNKIAYVMHSYGYTVTNPCAKVLSIHLHKEIERPYNSKNDKIIGLHAFVHPSDSIEVPSNLEFELLTRNPVDHEQIMVNNWINNRRSFSLIVHSPINYVPTQKPASAAPKAEEKHAAESKQPSISTIQPIPSSLAAPPIKRPIAETQPSKDLSAGKIGYLQQKEFDKLGLEKLHGFTDRFALFADTTHYYFYDRAWPCARKIAINELGVFSAETDTIRFFLAGFLPPVLDIAPYTISTHPKHQLDSLFWQYPCRTEQDACEANLRAMPAGMNDQKEWNIYLGLPWATFIDKKRQPAALIGLVASRIKAGRAYLEDQGITLKIHTVCQHIFWRDIIKDLKRIDVTDFWISHKEKGLDEADGIRFHAWSLYAVNYREPDRRDGLEYKPLSARKTFASFVGAHMPHYLSDIRKRMATLQDLPGYRVLLNNEWHFNKVVYNFQAQGDHSKKDAIDGQAVRSYNEMLSDSIFSLCPAGAGPNSLRHWESLATGAIPVNLSDKLELPDLQRLLPGQNLRWEDAIIFHPENALDTLDQTLRSIPEGKRLEMQRNGNTIYQAIENMNCFDVTAAADSGIFEIIDRFKPQQIHISGQTSPVFDGIARWEPAIFAVAQDGLEPVIHFDQTERLSCLILDVVMPEGAQLEVELFRYQSFNKFSPLAPSLVIHQSGTKIVTLDSSQVIFAMGVKLKMRASGLLGIKVTFSAQTFRDYFAQKVRELDGNGVLKAASDSNEIRRDDTFDTENINSGEILTMIPKVVEPAKCNKGKEVFPSVKPRTHNLIGEPLQDGTTMYVHLMNRNENVAKNLDNWLGQKVDELILLDWSSTPGVETIPGVLKDPRVRIVRVEGQTQFIRTWAQNTASRMARYNRIFKCDSDVTFSGDFIGSHPLSPGEFWVGDWHQGRDFNERHLHGETYYHIDDFERVNGYDERIVSYGHDDTNLKDRMVLAGLVKRVVSYNQLYHEPHDNSIRTSNQKMVHPMVNTRYHRILTNESKLWSPSIDRVVVAKPIDNTKGQVLKFTLESNSSQKINESILNKAIDLVAGWYVPAEQLKLMDKEKKKRLIWEKSVE